jgi:hypothetical protein
MILDRVSSIELALHSPATLIVWHNVREAITTTMKS